jgi:predicted nucleic acid-binding protein
MSRVFVDTGAWYALVDKKDPDHGRVAELLREHRGSLLTSSYVFDETVTLVRYRLGWRVAHRLGGHLRSGGLARLVRVSPADEAAAWSIFERYGEKAFSFTDCTSFALIQRLEVPVSLAIDGDFRAFGLHCIPEVQ